MNPKELAEKIVSMFACGYEEPSTIYGTTELIESFLTEALAEAKKEARADECAYWSCMDDRFEKAIKKAAYEDAAKIVDSIWEKNKNCSPEAGILLEESITAIRHRAEEVKGDE